MRGGRIKFCRNFDRTRRYEGKSVRQESLLDWFSFELDLTKFLGLRVKIQSSRRKVYIPELFVSGKVIKAGFHVASCVAKQRRKGMEARYSVYPSSFRTWLIAVTKGDIKTHPFPKTFSSASISFPISTPPSQYRHVLSRILSRVK